MRVLGPVWEPGGPANSERKSEIALDKQLADQLCTAAKRAAKRLKLPAKDVLERTLAGVKAGKVVGIVALPGATLEILPKIDGPDEKVRASLLHMLCVAWNLRVADGELASLGRQRSDLLELLIGLFANRLLAAVRRGLPRRYVGREEDLRLLRGRLRIVRQITALAGRPDVLACRFDELSEDTPLNRVSKAAVVRLARITRSAANARLLAELRARLEPVADSADPLKEPVRLDRTNTAYHDLHQLARLFLSGDWQNTASGKSLGFSLLFPMWKLFEEFIGRSLRRVLAAPWRVDLQDRAYSALLDEQGDDLFQLKPDAVIHAPSGPIIVLDTKWKYLVPDDGTRKFGVDQGDVYQMLAYAQAYGIERLVLLYPWLDGVGDLDKGVNRRWRIAGTDRQLHIAAVDVGEPRSVDRALREIVGLPSPAERANGPASTWPLEARRNIG